MTFEELVELRDQLSDLESDLAGFENGEIWVSVNYENRGKDRDVSEMEDGELGEALLLGVRLRLEPRVEALRALVRAAEKALAGVKVP